MSDGVLVRLAPEDLPVRKNARFTHDRMNYERDVRGKRFRWYQVGSLRHLVPLKTFIRYQMDTWAVKARR